MIPSTTRRVGERRGLASADVEGAGVDVACLTAAPSPGFAAVGGFATTSLESFETSGDIDAPGVNLASLWP
jgi:hypothetical protein